MTYHPPVAQSVEREAYTFVVLGSSPSGRTTVKTTTSVVVFSVWQMPDAAVVRDVNDVALPRVRRAREYLVESKRSVGLYLGKIFWGKVLR